MNLIHPLVQELLKIFFGGPKRHLGGIGLRIKTINVGITIPILILSGSFQINVK